MLLVQYYWTLALQMFEKRGEKGKGESVLERREMQNTAHPRSYVSALSGGESIGGDEV